MVTRNSPRPVLKDVAHRADVSLTTVSLVLSGKAGPNIPEATQARVLSAAAELGYRPNAIARGLRRGRSDTFGFISDEIATTPFAGAMIQGAQDAAWETGIVLLLINTGRDRRIEARGLELMHERQVDALIYATMFHQVVDPPPALREGPAVLLDARARDASLASVVPDEAGGAYAAIDALAGAGHRRIGFVQDVEPIPATPERLEGYRRALADNGLPFEPELVVLAPSNAHGGYEAALRLLDLSRPPTAFFCFNDRMAMGVYRAIAYQGLRIPDDVSVVGFDNQEQIAPWLMPALTTVALPHYEMGRWAVQFLMQALEVGASDTPQHRMACPLVERDSVRALRP